jgi:large subunit ribosomal protein L32
MPVPKRKRSRARRDKRFANKGVEETAFLHCPQCQYALLPHQACKSCGFYKGEKIVATKADRGLKRQENKETKKVTPEQEGE